MNMLLKSLAVAAVLTAGAAAIAPAANAQPVHHTTVVVRHRAPVRHCTMQRVKSHGHWVRVRRCR